MAQLVFDVTVRFCERYIDKRSRTHDQMVQAARSGVQNIAEGSKASGTSKKFELKLTNVARASLEELRLDYEDFLRQRGLPIWEKTDPRRAALIDRRCRSAGEVAEWVREVHERCRLGGLCGPDGQNGLSGLNGQQHQARSLVSTKSTKSILSTPPPTYPEIAANGALLLIAVASSLLDRQISAQAAAFEKEGGFTERLYKRRTQLRENR